MFICNISLKKKNFFNFFIYIIAVVIIISLLFFIIHKISNSRKIYVNDSNPYEEIYDIADSNYTNMLKDCYENLSDYVGKKFKYTGFVHRVYDLKESQFVLAREMFTSPVSGNKAEVVIVGFICELDGTSQFEKFEKVNKSSGDKNISTLKEKTWVEVEGTIAEGFYHSKVPVIKVTSIKEAECPKMPFVNPPDGGFVN